MAENGQEEVDPSLEDQLLAEDEAEESTETMENGHSDDYQKLIDHGIDKKVADELIKIYKTGKLSQSDLDDRAMDALKEFPAEDAVSVLKQFCDSSLEHVANKSAFLCGQMKMFRQRTKIQGMPNSAAKGPDETKLKEILARTGYTLDVTTGQRKYGGPPPDWTGISPGSGHEVFCGKIPKDIFEDELIPLFEKCGKIWDLRLMVDSVTGFSRGYCFVTFCEKEGAVEAKKQLDNHEIRKGKRLKVNISIANVRLYVGSIPKSKSKEDIKEEFSKLTEGLVDVIVYGSADNPKWKNRGFAFLEYDSHKSASAAKRRFTSRSLKAWGGEFVVDWADPLEEPDTSTMSKVLYVRNLTSDVTEELLKEKFGYFGKLERAKKIKDYGFIHFEEREDALKALESLNNQKIGGMEIEVSLAKPPTENRKKEQRKREQDRRGPVAMYPGYDDYWCMPPGRMPPPPPPPLSGRGMRRPPPPPPPPARGGYDPYYDDYYPYPEEYDYYGAYAPPPPPGPLRGRGRGGALPPPPVRGRGAPPFRAARGGIPVGRGTRGSNRAGRGGVPARGARGGGSATQKAVRGGKRKAGTDFSQGQSKRRVVSDNWGAQPIAQQPLDQSNYGTGSGYTGNDAQWYQDSYGGNW
ncbi:nuclear ribonucleoprotein R-like isoform X1 [Octopus vulgaris]|uniref:Nuclear ribonucleoprotein R-like isoform X1 n=1 Tax=Octopus vulgaris TaxID=6645 RepID=A0AA36ASL7_OCTVU|nr:nuclear ribonucleoprotein R-like isoform X1 [Octopus vulgaris]